MQCTAPSLVYCQLGFFPIHFLVVLLLSTHTIVLKTTHIFMCVRCSNLKTYLLESIYTIQFNKIKSDYVHQHPSIPSCHHHLPHQNNLLFFTHKMELFCEASFQMIFLSRKFMHNPLVHCCNFNFTHQQNVSSLTYFYRFFCASSLYFV